MADYSSKKYLQFYTCHGSYMFDKTSKVVLLYLIFMYKTLHDVDKFQCWQFLRASTLHIMHKNSYPSNLLHK